MNSKVGDITWSSLLSLLTVAFASCGGESAQGQGTGSTPQPQPTIERVVYRADQDTDEMYELYIGGSGVKLNGKLLPGTSVGDFAITLDNSAVVYVAAQDSPAGELYRVFFASPGVGTKLSSPLVAGGGVQNFKLTPDGTGVIYSADQDTNEVYELYRVSFATPGVSMKLNASLPSGGDAFSFLVR